VRYVHRHTAIITVDMCCIAFLATEGWDVGQTMELWQMMKKRRLTLKGDRCIPAQPSATDTFILHTASNMYIYTHRV
jgi:hypothetical protein